MPDKPVRVGPTFGPVDPRESPVRVAASQAWFDVEERRDVVLVRVATVVAVTVKERPIDCVGDDL